MATLILTALVVFLFIPERGSASQEQRRFPIRAEEIETPTIAWYGVYLQNRKVGYGRFFLERGLRSGDSVFVMGFEISINVVSLGIRTQMQRNQTLQFAPTSPYGLVCGSFSESTADSKRTIEITKSGSGFDIVIQTGGEEQKSHVAALDYTLADALTAEYWFRKHPDTGQSIVLRTLDVSQARTDQGTLTVLSTGSAMTSGVKVDYFEARLSYADRKSEEIWKVDE